MNFVALILVQEIVKLCIRVSFGPCKYIVVTTAFLVQAMNYEAQVLIIRFLSLEITLSNRDMVLTSDVS